MVQYLGLFISDVCKPIIIDYWEEITNTKLLENIKADHITLKFKPSKKDIEKYLSTNGVEFNQLIPITLIGYAQDPFAQAFKVSVPIKCDNIHPHITMALNETAAAKYSNDLLINSIENNTYTKIDSGIKLYCKLQTFPEY